MDVSKRSTKLPQKIGLRPTATMKGKLMKTVNRTRTNTPRFVDDIHVLVTKEFVKNVQYFGTPEYRLWREIKAECPNAKMVTKSIKKNPNKRTATKNMTYERMADYIRTQPDAQQKMTEFQKQIAMSRIQTNPYRCVLAWFCMEFENYDSYKAFFQKEAEEASQEKSIFHVVKNEVTIQEPERKVANF